MRLTMRPVTLGRVVETCYLAERYSTITERTLIENLNVSPRRAREILLESVRMNLLKESNEDYITTESGTTMIQAIRSKDWHTIHTIMLSYPFYAKYHKAVQEIGPATPAEILLYLTDSDVQMNQTTIDVLGDWTERIGSVQRNVFTGKYYTVSNKYCPIIPALFSAYDNLNRTAGLSLRQRYVEIPRLRETVCEELNLSRDSFDMALLALYRKNIGILELSGAPETTHAKRSQKKVKSVVFSELPDWINMQLTSDQYLSGIQFGPKQYYYLAIHGRDLK